MGFDRGFATTDQKEDAVTTLARLGEGRIVVGGASDLDVMDLADLPISDATQEALDDKADDDDVTAVASSLSSHTSDTANPHGVTAAQAGTYTSGEIDNALALKMDAGAVPTELTDLDTSVTGAELDALKQAADGHGDIVTHNANEFATAAQGGKADSAVQPADIADFETSTQLDSRDTANRSRANHTGTQAISTVSGLQTALDGKADDADVVKTVGDSDIEITSATRGLILRSPNGTRYRLTVGDDGTLDTNAV